MEDQGIKQRIKEILNKEQVQKEEEYKHGKIYLTENYLIWEKKKQYGSVIIPLNSIQYSEHVSKIGIGNLLKVIYGEDEKEALFPFIRKGLLSYSTPDDVQKWIKNLEPIVQSRVFKNIFYAGGHNTYPEKRNGRLIVNPAALIFQETKSDWSLEIPIEKFKTISVKTTSEIKRLKTFLGGPLLSMGLPDKKKFVLVEYEDELEMKQTPLFDFPLDLEDKKKGTVMRAIYTHLKGMKSTESKSEDPIKILKTRFAKGEISKKEYEEMKKILKEK